MELSVLVGDDGTGCKEDTRHTQRSSKSSTERLTYGEELQLPVATQYDWSDVDWTWKAIESSPITRARLHHICRRVF